MNASGHSAKRTNENTSTSTIPTAYSSRTPAWKTIPRAVRSSVAASRRPYARYQSASPTSAATAPSRRAGDALSPARIAAPTLTATTAK